MYRNVCVYVNVYIAAIPWCLNTINFLHNCNHNWGQYENKVLNLTWKHFHFLQKKKSKKVFRNILGLW